MRRLGFVVGALAAVGAWGCSHENAAERSASAGYAQPKSDFAAAYDSVKSGARQTANAGRLALRGVGRGAVQVVDRSKEAVTRGGSKVDDGWITTKVKSELASNGVDPLHVHVDTDNKVVILSGTVESAAEREKAVALARAVKDVASVTDPLFVGLAKR